MKIAWVCNNNIGPYYYYMFDALSKKVSNLTVFIVKSKKGEPRPWPGYMKEINWEQFYLDNNSKILKFLKLRQPEIVFIAGNERAYIYASLWSKIKGIPCVLESDTHSPREPNKRIKEKAKSIVINSLFLAIFVPGKKHLAYRMSQGFRPYRIYTGSYVTDNGHFSNTKKLYYLPSKFPDVFFLTVSRLTKVKNISTLIKAFEKYREKGGNWSLVISGEGPEEAELKRSIPENLKENIYFAGWVGYDEIPGLYIRASCFVLASIWESWGVVVNEAMAAGLPILLSKNCGCADDLCYQGINGFLFDPLNDAELAELMLLVSSNKVDLKSMGKASKRIIANYTPDRWAETVIQICKSLLNNNHEGRNN